MSTDIAQPSYPFAEEVASSVIHAVGLVLSIAGLAILVAFSAMYGGPRAVVASSVFGGTLILLIFIGEAVRDAFNPRKTGFR